MRKTFLEKRMLRLKAKKEALKNKAMASGDESEVRSINEQIEDLNAEIAELQEEIAVLIDEGEQRAAGNESEIPATARSVNGGIVSSFDQRQQPRPGDNEDPFSTMEYRHAFMRYAQAGTPIPAELRAGQSVNTADIGVIIPMTVMNEVINTVRKRYGTLYSKVRKIAVQGGVEYPIGNLKASFKWIGEGSVSPRQKPGDLGKVAFGYHTAEIRISQTFLSRLLSLPDFERKISEVIATAYLEAMDYGIINGSGNGSMLGILNDPRVTNTVTMTASNISNWTSWKKNFFSKLPLGYRGGEFIFPVSTVDSYLETMADANNNPIFKQAAGLDVKEDEAGGRFFGRAIDLVEPDIIADFDSASANDVIGVYWQPQEYAINENFGFTMRRYFDDETNEWVDKALAVVDGKTLNPTGFYKILKG